jgi:DNA invertase Pin-like site-specific DNA recombinase
MLLSNPFPAAPRDPAPYTEIPSATAPRDPLISATSIRFRRPYRKHLLTVCPPGAIFLLAKPWETDPPMTSTATATKRVALYLRVSTAEQTIENQRRELRAIAERHGWEIAAEFADEGISGAKGRDRRPGYDQLCRGIARREFDQVAAWSVDRLSRSLQDLVAFLGELHAKGIDLYLHQQGLDTATPAGRAMFQMLGVFAEFERAMIAERVKAGLSRARSEGKRLGRPLVTPDKEATIKRHLASGTGIVKTARLAGVGVSAVQRIKAAAYNPF